MIDTVVLNIPLHRATIDSDRFSPSLNLLKSCRGVFNATYYLTESQRREHTYLPRLRVTQRPLPGGLSKSLRIEFSIPKLLFGNNFDEVSANDFSLVISKLKESLSDMGVLVEPRHLINADVFVVHYSKNLVFTEGTSARFLIQQISKAEATKHVEVRNHQYQEDGLSYRWHNNSYEVIWYDKLAELKAAQKTQKGRIESDSLTQHSLYLDSLPDTFEVLRFEVRLIRRAKMRSLFKKLDFGVDLTFDNLFSITHSKAVLGHFWHKMTESLPKVPASSRSLSQALRNRQAAHPSLTIRNNLALLAFEYLSHEEGFVQFRTFIESASNPETWRRLKKESEQLSLSTYSMLPGIKSASRQLAKFDLVKLSNYSNK